MFEKTVQRAFNNMGFVDNRRAFRGFAPKSETLRQHLGVRDALRLDMVADDILSALPLGAGQKLSLLVFDAKGRLRPDCIGVQANATLQAAGFESDALLGWAAAQGGQPDAKWRCVEVPLEGLSAFKATAACTVWVIRPMTQADLVTKPSAGVIEVSLKKAAEGNKAPLPPLLGDVRDEFTVARGTAQSYRVNPGEVVQIIDVEGQQCSDFMALRYDALGQGIEQTIDSTATRTMVRAAYPGPGLLDKFFDADLRPMINVVQDTCGRHDMFGMACTARGYEERGFPGHLNCSDNISGALDEFGVRRRPAWPAINFFWNTWVDHNTHQLLTEESHSRPGDYVALRAMDRLVCVTTACPDDLDPINGWNPTDVHVRIYPADAPIRRAVAYREKENAPMSISSESAFHPATSKLTTQFAPVRDVWAPVQFPSLGTIGEYWACREKVTLQDMSSLRKYDIAGPDAERLLQHAMTRDVARLAVWRGSYALICDASGAVVDDGTLFRMAPDLFRWCCGSEESGRVLQELADAEGLQARIHGMGGALPNLALQGPHARDVLRKIVFTQPTVPSLENLKWFGCTVARVGDREGIPFMLTRSGYTGELGYELFCARTDAAALWDAVMAAGAEFGISPMGSAALEIIRIEAGLAAANAEFAPGVDAFEAGLGFAVDPGKAAFTGKDALTRNAASPRRLLRGLKLDCDDMLHHGCQVYAGERPVGVITSATRSPLFERTIAMARLAIEHAEVGTRLEVGQLDGHMKRLPATVCDIPFHDPKRKRARA